MAGIIGAAVVATTLMVTLAKNIITGLIKAAVTLAIIYGVYCIYNGNIQIPFL